MRTGYLSQDIGSVKLP